MVHAPVDGKDRGHRQCKGGGALGTGLSVKSFPHSGPVIHGGGVVCPGHGARHLYLRLLMEGLIGGEKPMEVNWRKKLKVRGVVVTDCRALYVTT